MAVRLISGIIPNYLGTSGDTKPTSVKVGSTFYETDTKTKYVCYDGTNWVLDLRGVSGSASLNMTTATDPLANAAVTTVIVNAFSGVIVTLTGAGNNQTIQAPTNTTAGKMFTVVNNDTSTNNVPVIANGVTFTVTPGEAQTFIWDGSAWGPIDIGITAIPVAYNQGGSGVADDLANYNIWVDGARTDTYTADGSMARPFKTVLAALTVINADVGKSWTMNIATGTYSDNLTITGPRYLAFKSQGGVVLSGTILINSGVGSYDRIEFIGAHGPRTEKGPAMTISGKITATRSDDSLIYVTFYGCLISGEIECTTLGTWVLQYEKCRINGAITGTFTRVGHEQVLVESYGFNEFVGAITGWVSLYNCHDSDFYSTINTTPYYESRFTHCAFIGNSISIVPVGGASSTLIYVDGVSYKSFKARTPTITGASYSHLDGGVLIGATTEMLVGGGDGTNPVWTTATGTGAPVRTTSPTIVTPLVDHIDESTVDHGVVIDSVTLKDGAVIETTPATGTGAQVRATSPTLVTPVLGVASGDSLRLGKAGLSGELELYSEQGATDYVASIKPNAAMTENADFFFPAAKPAATYFMVMTNAGIMAFDSTVYAALAGDQTINGVKTFGSFPITPSAMPSTDYQMANKAYVDSVAVGLTPKDACRLATIAALPACTYAGTPNFTLTGDAVGQLADIDSVTPAATNRILVKTQADAKQNGIYTVTTLGDGGNAFVLTRATDYDASAEVGRGTFMYISAGSTNAGYQFIQTTATPTLDTNDLVFATLYAPLADTLQTVTNRGATTTNALTMGGVVNTKAVTESGIKNIVFGDSPYTVLSTDRHVYGKTVGGAINVLLPPATGSGRILSFNKRDSSANIMTITADTTGTPDLIDGSATKALENIYDSITIQDNAANEWANVIRSSDVASNTYRVSSSGRADFKTVGECVTYLNSLSSTDGVRVVIDGGDYDFASKVTVNATMPITFEGSGVSSTIFNTAAGLLNSDMFEIITACDFTQIGFQGTDAWVAGTSATFVRINADNLYCEFKDFVMNKCKKGIEVIQDSEVFALDFIISNATVAGIEMNASGAIALDAEIGNFDTCAVGVHLLTSSAGDVYLNALRFINGAGGVGILYVPATFTYSNFTLNTCEHNHVGTFLSGFDFTLTRDANIEVINCVGEEDKSPHAKVNVVGNAVATAVASNTWTKCTFTNTNSYACKWTVADNRLTYQSNHPSDVMMWISGNVSCATNAAQNLQFGIVKGGVSTTIYGQMGVTTDATGRKFAFSMNVYLDDVESTNYFELWVRNTTGTEDPTIVDVNWLVKST